MPGACAAGVWGAPLRVTVIPHWADFYDEVSDVAIDVAAANVTVLSGRWWK